MVNAENEHFREKRFQMVDRQLRDRGIKDDKILRTFEKLPRHLFVPPQDRNRAYDDRPLPIGEGQTISQPYIVALMTALLGPQESDRVLEIGTGSGYQTAALAELAGEVFTVERSQGLLERAKKVLMELGYENINFSCKDGTTGWGEHAPYRKILGTGAVPEVPPSLISQLADPGKLVIPVGSRRGQNLLELKKINGDVKRQEGIACSFVPLVGEEGW